MNYLQQEIYERCRRPSNVFGMGIFDHVKAVVKNGKELAEQYGGDVEVVMIAGWLHDIASITDESLYAMHHEHGAQMAGKILEGMDYPPEKTALVQACIRSHRGSVPAPKGSIEEWCVADADAISHFDSVPSLLYMAYAKKGMELEEGKTFVREKLKRSFAKLSPEGKLHYQEKYRQVMELLGEGGGARCGPDGKTDHSGRRRQI